MATLESSDRPLETLASKYFEIFSCRLLDISKCEADDDST